MNRGVFAGCTALALVLVSPPAEARTGSSIGTLLTPSVPVSVGYVTNYTPAPEAPAEGQQRTAVARGSGGRSGGSSAGRSGGSSAGRGPSGQGRGASAGRAPSGQRGGTSAGRPPSTRGPQATRAPQGRTAGTPGRAPGQRTGSPNAGRGNDRRGDDARAGAGPTRRPGADANVRANQGGRAYGNAGRRAVPRSRVYGNRGGSRDRTIVSNRYYINAPYRSYYYPSFSVGVGYYDPYYRYGYGYGYDSGYAYSTPYIYDPYYAGSYGGYDGDVDVDYAAHGWLRLRVQPRHADVFVDGYYVGVVDEFDGAFQSLELTAGPHRIEIAAEGFRPITLDVRILPDRRTELQQVLVPVR